MNFTNSHIHRKQNVFDGLRGLVLTLPALVIPVIPLTETLAIQITKHYLFLFDLLFHASATQHGAVTKEAFLFWLKNMFFGIAGFTAAYHSLLVFLLPQYP